MPKSLAKVQKKIRKKYGGSNSLHENSRNSQRLRRAGAREDKLARVSASRAKSNLVLIHRVAFFRIGAQKVTGPISTAQVQEIIQTYIDRDAEELSKLRKDRRPGRPTSTREDLLSQRIAGEQREYEIGYFMPDIQDEGNLERLAKWNGEWTSLGTIKFTRITKAGDKSPANFPPTGTT
ncbi:MAG: Rad2 nuclease [Chaenotheca gracillima]|nr:MAG: Rad2 nuclease [Chaenotheca gracillima]